MSIESIQAEIIAVLKEVQVLSGRPYKDIPLTARPVLDLEGFDSLCSVEATVMVEARLKIADLKKPSIFISEDEHGKHALSILEISQQLQKIINTTGGH